MTDVIETCTVLQSPTRPAQAAIPIFPGTPFPSGFALVIAKKWPDSAMLSVTFMDGDPVTQARVQQVAHQWSRFCNIRFKFVSGPDADIRISFKQPGSWSYIGTDAQWIAKDQPTMNFGWLTPTSPPEEYNRVVLHEFGHALGLIHEHQNPAGGIPWNKDAVYEYYSGPPNNWTTEQVDVNLFDTYDRNMVKFSGFDAESIMLYPIPNEFTIGDFEVGWNTGLSTTDVRWIGQVYPKPNTELLVDGPSIAAAIGAPDEIDQYTFLVFSRGRYRIETTGSTDLVMSLYGPEDDTKFIAGDDDSGERLNPRLVLSLDPGKYTVRVQHFSKRRTGEYEIAVQTEQVRTAAGDAME
ncbi:MAG: peptidase [Caldilineaceae bacterium]|nr:peptidase [Caldilineaceae bacterium]